MMKSATKILGRFDEIDISQKIGILFIVNKIYLDKDLKVAGFAKKIDIPTRSVTPVFKALYGHRFTELANMYRVEYAKTKIEARVLNNRGLEALADMSGFKSQSTFVNVFKKEAGKSPDEYWRSCSFTE